MSRQEFWIVVLLGITGLAGVGVGIVATVTWMEKRERPDPAVTYRDWSELLAELELRYRLAEKEEDSCKIVFEYDGGTLQAVTVAHYESMSHHWVDFTSGVAASDAFPAEQALERSFSMGAGGYVLDDDTFVIRAQMPLNRLDWTTVELYLHAVAWAANEAEVETGQDKF